VKDKTMRTGLRKNMRSDSGNLIVETSRSTEFFFAKFVGWGQSFVGWSEVSAEAALNDLADQAGTTVDKLQADCEFVNV
jgi:hypothetical protein